MGKPKLRRQVSTLLLFLFIAMLLLCIFSCVYADKPEGSSQGAGREEAAPIVSVRIMEFIALTSREFDFGSCILGYIKNISIALVLAFVCWLANVLVRFYGYTLVSNCRQFFKRSAIISKYIGGHAPPRLWGQKNKAISSGNFA